MSKVFEPGERALFLDGKGRRYLVKLAPGAQFHTHSGFVEHDAVIGQPEGVATPSSGGSTFVVVRPAFTDFVLKMPRGAQVVYPKDIATILMAADVYPGATVLEAGTGSGALTLGLLRAVGPDGRVISYELRADHADRAKLNIESFLGGVPTVLDLRAGDVVDTEVEDVDRIVLDLPEPWRVVPTAVRSLRAGGIFCSYVPGTVQVARTCEALAEAGFIELETSETLVRTWHVEGQSVRPDHRMVAHTGFITRARFLGR